jgi:hypothetical protein
MVPREIRAQLSRVDHKCPKLLAQEADTLWTLWIRYAFNKYRSETLFIRMHGQPVEVAAMPVPIEFPLLHRRQHGGGHWEVPVSGEEEVVVVVGPGHKQRCRRQAEVAAYF